MPLEKHAVPRQSERHGQKKQHEAPIHRKENTKILFSRPRRTLTKIKRLICYSCEITFPHGNSGALIPNRPGTRGPRRREQSEPVQRAPFKQSHGAGPPATEPVPAALRPFPRRQVGSTRLDFVLCDCFYHQNEGPGTGLTSLDVPRELGSDAFVRR